MYQKTITFICFETKNMLKIIPICYKKKYILFIHSPEEDVIGIQQSEKSHNIIQLIPDEDKHYLLMPYPTLMQPLKNFSPERVIAVALDPNIDLQSIGIYSKFEIQHHIRTKQF